MAPGETACKGLVARTLVGAAAPGFAASHSALAFFCFFFHAISCDAGARDFIRSEVRC